MNDETKQLMIHVERIVRPVHATANRKLRMRRELLAHLHSALEEEKSKGGSDADIFARAQSRLGNPAALTQQLQLTVPHIEQLFLAKLPLPKLLNRWEKQSEKQWGLLTTAQATAMMGFSMIFTVFATGYFLIMPEDHRSAFFNLQSDHRSHYLLICLAAGILATAIPLLIITLLEKALHQHWRSRSVIIFSILVASCVFLWTLLINSQVALRPITAYDILWGIMTGITLVALQITLAKIITRMGNHSLEWKQLDLAE